MRKPGQIVKKTRPRYAENLRGNVRHLPGRLHRLRICRKRFLEKIDGFAMRYGKNYFILLPLQ